MPEDARVRRVAEILYDELTGKKPGVERGFEWHESNAALAHYWPKGTSDRDEEQRNIIREASHHGMSVHFSNTDRWGLANRLAELVVKELEPEPVGRRVTIRRRWHAPFSILWESLRHPGSDTYIEMPARSSRGK